MSEPLDVSEDQLVQYVLGELRRDEAQALERRLDADSELAAEVSRLRQVLDLMPYASMAEPPPALRDRILGAATARRAPAARHLAPPAASCGADLRRPRPPPWPWRSASTPTGRDRS